VKQLMKQGRLGKIGLTFWVVDGDGRKTISRQRGGVSVFDHTEKCDNPFPEHPASARPFPSQGKKDVENSAVGGTPGGKTEAHVKSID